VIARDPTSRDAETRLITLEQLHIMRTRALQLLDQLTALSGYGQIAQDTDLNPAARLQVEKILKIVSKAVQSIQSCLAMVKDIEDSDAQP
jgi:hypothetical protein